MEKENNRSHWENIYQTKNPEEVSWTQAIPRISLEFISSFDLSLQSKIIDIGGGDSKLVDHLLALGFTDITVLDISSHALAKAQARLGDKATQVQWIQSDILDFQPDTQYDVWHDRATFHFLTEAEQVQQYVELTRTYVGKYLTIGTFSDSGPLKCSGLPIKQYSEDLLTEELQNGFDKIKCVQEEHITPFQTQQNFLFCSFKKQC